ncbi:MAG: NUDIX domain-containing protein [Alphaproteobacteria bacterium]|nr:NUDIX domain-containing protein [Alphaproteobacteria bacterium]
MRRDDGLHLWVARRAMTKATFPGELDLMVAGGHPTGLTLRENLVKECHEEAGVNPVLAETAISVGSLSFCCKQPDGIIDEFQFIYDLEVPINFTPRNMDGEVDAFYLWSVEQVMESIHDTDAFVFDSALVIIDFLIRHGVIDAGHPEYCALTLGMRRLDMR